MTRCPIHPTVQAQMDALYARLPRIACQRRCQRACGPIVMARLEWQRITDHLGHTPEGNESLRCPMLAGNHCNVYALRPLICRLYGLVDDPLMRCHWGCIPDRWLSRVESYALMTEMERIAR